MALFLLPLFLMQQQLSLAATLQQPLHVSNSKDGMAATIRNHPDPRAWMSDIFPGKTAPGSIRMPLDQYFQHDFAFFTELGVGTPPQFQLVLVDMASPQTFVAANNCTCCPGGRRYTSLDSSTFKLLEPNVTYIHPWMDVHGNLSQDTISLGRLSVEDQAFINGDKVWPIGISYDNLCLVRGMLGLTLSGDGSSMDTPSPFMTMAASNTLDANLFALRLRRPYELSFGELNPLQYKGDITYIPVTNKSSPWLLTGRWQAAANSLSVDPLGFHFSLENLTASFSTSSAFILLPDALVIELLGQLGFDWLPMMPPSIPCSQRRFLPYITFNLSGQNFTLTGYDYTLRWPIDEHEVRCASALFPIRLDPAENVEIMLGTAFLRGFYSVFDLDRMAVGFAKLS